MNVNYNSISLMSHTITINDMIDNIYYRSDIAIAKNKMAMKILYINNLNDLDRNKFYYLINAKISEDSKIANNIKPIFKFIQITNNTDKDYFLDIDDTSYYNYNKTDDNYYLEYKTNKKNNYKINIYQTEEDNYKFNFRDWNWHISYLDPFYSTLKFKIKEERITRNLRNDLTDYKRINDNNYSKLSKDLIDFKNYMYRNDMYIKYNIGILYLILFMNIFL
jgi:hypothetical protein